MKSMHFIPFMAGLSLLSSCCGSWSRQEKELIRECSPTMHVCTVDSPEEEALLRSACRELTPAMIRSEEYRTLAARMLATVTSPEQNGVGIAGPQVGISRRVVAVMRVDRQGEPFEVYPNIRILSHEGEMVPGPEGCLSVPGKRGEVARWRDIVIGYTSPKTLQDTTERVTGFTAVIFQHECDHLDGVIYTDKALSVCSDCGSASE